MIDVTTWLGSWPFQAFDINSAAALNKHLEAHGIARALVSAPETVFHPDPHQGNALLCRRLGRYPHLLPVPVINPILPGWEARFGEYAAAGVCAVRVLPNYHRYGCADACMGRLAGTLQRAGIPLIIQMRMEDERAHHPLCRIPAVDASAMTALAGRFPRLRILASCAYLTEVPVLAACSNVYIDTAFTEALDTLPSLFKKIPARRVLFGSHTPFLYTRAGIMKCGVPGISRPQFRAVTAANARRLFRLTPHESSTG